MVNGSFVFGMDDDGPDVFDRTVDWAVGAGHRDRHLPHPDALSRHGAAPPDRAEGRIAAPTTGTCYDTRHVVYHADADDAGAARGRLLARLPRLLPLGRDLAGRRGPGHACGPELRHLAYAGGWKKFEPLWDLAIRSRHVNAMLPALERTLDAFVGARRKGRDRLAKERSQAT